MASFRLAWAVSALLALAIKTAAMSEDTRTALNEACDKDFLEPIPHVPRTPQMTVEKCKQMVGRIPEDVNGEIDIYTGTTPLTKAAAFGLVEVTKVLIDAGADVNKVNRAWGLFDTALFVAAKIGRPKVCEALLDAGADINMKNNEGYGKTALEMAMENNQDAVVDVLKKHGASIPQLGLAEILEFHGLSSASELNGPSKKDVVFEGESKRFSPLMFAAGIGNKDAVKLLLDAGADVNFPEGMPLYMAIDYISADVSQMLVEAGADVHAPLLLHRAITAARRGASKQERVDIVKMLIAAGVDLDATDSNGETALYNAANGEQAEIARILIEAGADASIRPHKTYWKTDQNMRYLEQLNQEING